MKKFYSYKFLSIMAVLFIVTGTVSCILIFNFPDQLSLASAVRDAEMEIKIISSFRTIYTNEVVKKAQNYGMKVSHDFIGKEDTIPLAASMTKSIGAAIESNGSEQRLFLYSPYPFPWRKGSEGLNDQFRKDAWSYLTKKPDESFSRIEFKDGRRILRYAVADKMRQDCIHCHNTHPDTPKNDWKLNDVRGLLEINRPLANLSLANRKATKISLLVLIATSLGIFLTVIATLTLKKERENWVQIMHLGRLASLGDMAGGVAHEINNPLTIILGSITLLKKANRDHVLKHQILEKHFERIETTAQRISKIVSGLVAVSRSSADDIKPIELKDLFTGILGLFSEQFKNSKIELKINLESPEFNNKIMGNQVQLSQVFINLLSNAYDAVENVSEKWIEIVVFDDNSESVVIKIVDSGDGIPEEVRKKMFNPFFTSKPIGKGTGLGLSISKSIVRKCGGDLRFDNTNRNTCFIVRLLKQK